MLLPLRKRGKKGGPIESPEDFLNRTRKEQLTRVYTLYYIDLSPITGGKVLHVKKQCPNRGKMRTEEFGEAESWEKAVTKST